VDCVDGVDGLDEVLNVELLSELGDRVLDVLRLDSVDELFELLLAELLVRVLELSVDSVLEEERVDSDEVGALAVLRVLDVDRLVSLTELELDRVDNDVDVEPVDSDDGVLLLNDELVLNVDELSVDVDSVD
jgi:hypothetical protein